MVAAVPSLAFHGSPCGPVCGLGWWLPRGTVPLKHLLLNWHKRVLTLVAVDPEIDGT